MIVFHYTDIDKFEQILAATSCSNQRLLLKAKHRCFLNDDAQRTFGRYLLPSCIEAVEDELGVDINQRIAPLFKEAGYLDFILKSVNTYDDHCQGLGSYVLSFSEDQDNADLWKKNAHGGRGLALGFDTDKLLPDYDRFVNVCKDKCTYWSDNIKEASFRLDTHSKLYADICETYRMMANPKVIDSFKMLYSQESPAAVMPQSIKDTLVSNIITTYDVFHKQDVWRNEKEYRISLSSMPIDVQFVKDENGDYIPYANVSLPVPALRMIVIGPKCGRNSYGMVKSLLMQRGVSLNVTVLNSALKF